MENRPRIELTLEEAAVVLAILDELRSDRPLTAEILELVHTTYSTLLERSRAATA